MFKHKLTGALLLGAVFAAGAGLCCVEPTVASAAAILQLDIENSSLALPTSYEQYLTLSSPSDIAVSERYLAIAEGSTIYLFDREEEIPTYHTYDHAPAHNKAQISKIQFSDNEELFFSDSLLGFYELDLSDLSALKPVSDTSLTSLSTFYLEKDTVFEVSVVNGTTTYLSAPISDPKTATSFANDDNTITPQLSYANGRFYSAVGALVTAYSYSETEQIYKATGNYPLQPGLTGLKAISVVGDSLYYSVSRSSSTVSDGLYRCDLTSTGYNPLLTGSGYGALTSYDGKLYAVKNNAVMEYDLGDGTGFEKTNYEISSASDSVNRLSAATDIACTRDLLVVADKGNKRISVAVLKCEENGVCISDISVVSCIDSNEQPFAPDLIATDGEIVAIASLDEKESCIYIYHIGNNTFSECHPIDDLIVDIACVNGACYYITVSGRGKAAEGCNIISCQDSLPAALTADEDGTLYVVDQTGHVWTFSEEEFTDCSVTNGDGPGDYIRFPFTSLQTDGRGNFFYIANKTLYMNETELCRFCETSFINDGQGQIHEPSAFVIDFEDNELFLLYDNYIVMVPLVSSEH